MAEWSKASDLKSDMVSMRRFKPCRRRLFSFCMHIFLCIQIEMSVVIHRNAVPNKIPFFEKTLKQRIRRQNGSRNLLFDEQYANRKKVWNRWTGDQINYTRKALHNMQRNSLFSNNRNANAGNNNNNNINLGNNITTANLNGPEWRIGVGNYGYEPVPKILRPNRTVRQKRRKV